MPVKRRLAFVFPGFEAMPVAAHKARFVREARKTAPVYNMVVEIGEGEIRDGPVSTAEIPVVASGEGWKTETEVVIFGLADLSASYAARNPVSRVAAGLLALGDFLVSGTFLRFLATSWRYGLFFAYPIALLAVSAAIAFVAAVILPLHSGFQAAIAAVLFVALLWAASARLHFLLMMDDWAFARDMVRERRPEFGHALTALSKEIEARIGRSQAEEVLFAAHSFGAISAVFCLADLLHGGRTMPSTGLLTVGSSLLKAALHPAAARLRNAIAAVANGPVAWLDVQSLTDPMNFYRSNPAGSLGIECSHPPKVTQIRFRHQLTPATYRAIKRNFFRVHRQFVYAVEKRSDYSFHAILCGPEPFTEVARRGGLAQAWPAGPADCAA